MKIPSSKELLWIVNLNITAFPNLVNLDLSGMGLRGSIPTEIGSLTNLTSLVLSNNRLQGKLLQFSSSHYPLQILSASIPSTVNHLKNLGLNIFLIPQVLVNEF